MRTGIAAAVMLVITPAAAQTTSPAPAGSPGTIPEKQSDTPVQGGRSESLSSKLNKTDGVIAPEGDVDPGMHVPAPDPNPHSTPVIPPSATPGGKSAK